MADELKTKATLDVSEFLAGSRQIEQALDGLSAKMRASMHTDALTKAMAPIAGLERAMKQRVSNISMAAPGARPTAPMADMEKSVEAVEKKVGGLLGVFGKLGPVLSGVGSVFMKFGGIALSVLGQIAGMALKAFEILGNMLTAAVERLTKAFLILYGAASAALALIARKGIAANIAFEQLSKSFEVFLGSQPKAQQMMSWLQKFSDNTGYTMQQLAGATKLLSAFGLEASTWLPRVGNLASGMNADLESVAETLGRVKSGQFGEAMEHLRGLGISRTLLEQQGLKFDKGGQFLGEASAMMTALGNIIDQRFGGLMQAMAHTLGGLLTTLSDRWTQFTREITGGLSQSLQTAISRFLDFVNVLKDSGTWAKVVQALSVPFNIAAGMILWLEGKIPQLVQAFVGAFESGKIEAAILKVANAGIEMFRWIGGVAAGVFAMFQQGFGVDLVSALTVGWNAMKLFLQGTLTGVSVLSKAFVILWNSVAGLWGMIQTVEGVGEKFFSLGFAGQGHLDRAKEIQKNSDQRWDAVSKLSGALDKLSDALGGAGGMGGIGSLLGKYGTTFQKGFESFGKSVPSAEDFLRIFRENTQTPGGPEKSGETKPGAGAQVPAAKAGGLQETIAKIIGGGSLDLARKAGITPWAMAHAGVAGGGVLPGKKPDLQLNQRIELHLGDKVLDEIVNRVLLTLSEWTR